MKRGKLEAEEGGEGDGKAMEDDLIFPSLPFPSYWALQMNTKEITGKKIRCWRNRKEEQKKGRQYKTTLSLIQYPFPPSLPLACFGDERE